MSWGPKRCYWASFLCVFTTSGTTKQRANPNSRYSYQINHHKSNQNKLHPRSPSWEALRPPPSPVQLFLNIKRAISNAPSEPPIQKFIHHVKPERLYRYQINHCKPDFKTEPLSDVQWTASKQKQWKSEQIQADPIHQMHHRNHKFQNHSSFRFLTPPPSPIQFFFQSNVSSHPPIPKSFIISIPQQTPRSMKSRQQASKSNEKASKSKQKQWKKQVKAITSNQTQATAMKKQVETTTSQQKPSKNNGKTSKSRQKTNQKQWRNKQMPAKNKQKPWITNQNQAKDKWKARKQLGKQMQKKIPKLKNK